MPSSGWPHRGGGPGPTTPRSSNASSRPRCTAPSPNCPTSGASWSCCATWRDSRTRRSPWSWELELSSGPLAPAPGPRRPQGQAGALPDMNCHDAREWLSDLLDGRPSRTEARAQIDAHLAGGAPTAGASSSRAAPGRGLWLLQAVEAAAGPRPASWTACFEARAPGPLVSGGALDWLSGRRDFSGFPSRPPRWCSWPRLGPCTSSRGHPSCDRQRRPGRDPRVKPATASLSSRGRDGHTGVAGWRTMPEGHQQRPRHRSRPLPAGCRLPVPPAAPHASSLAARRGGPRPGADEDAAERRGAHGRGSEIPPRVSSDAALRQLAPSAPGEIGCAFRAPRQRPAPCWSQADPSGSTESRFKSLRKDYRSGAGGTAERPTSQSPPVAPSRCQRRNHSSAWHASRQLTAGRALRCRGGSSALANQARQRCASCRPYTWSDGSR